MSVTAACFANKTYEASATAKCISNLLAVGFHRLVIDLYWDQNSLYWSLCPAELPLPSALSHSSSISVPPSSLSSSEPIAALPARSEETAIPAARDGYGAESQFERYMKMDPRQDQSSKGRDAGVEISSSADTQANATLSPRPTSTAILAAGQMPNEQLFTVGPYVCSRAADITLILGVLTDYVRTTNYILAANFKQIIIDLHSASPSYNPLEPALQPVDSKLPNSSSLLGSIFEANLSSSLYSPLSLFGQRANLNSSWSHAPPQDAPDDAYFTNVTENNGNSSSPDGWPSEGYLEFSQQSRLLLGFGSVDPQLSKYDFNSDGKYIFGSSFTSQEILATLASDGSVTNGCVFNPSTSSLSSVNSSWVYGPIAGTTFPNLGTSNSTLAVQAAESFTECGISPYLNTTIDNVTANVDAAPYLEFALASVWSWAPGQPLNDSYANNATFPKTDDDNDPATDFRCAYLNATSSDSVVYTTEASSASNQALTLGRWAVTFCQNRLPAACRDNNNPYAWFISSSRGRYSDVNDDCPNNSSFAVPRTALENRYLVLAAQDHFSTSSGGFEDNTKGLVWINFNSLNFESCWVSGINSTCPYTNNESQNEGQVVVPTVAALAIIVLAVLTILAKCGVNRRKSRKRRRIRDGWEYEGVPS